MSPKKRIVRSRTKNEARVPAGIRRRPRPPFDIGTLSGLGLLLVLAACRHSAAQTPPAASRAFPDITFRTALDETVRTADLKGDVVLVGLWTTTCGTCPEMRDAAERWNQSLAVQRVTVLAVNEDLAEKSWKAYMLKHPSTLIEVWDKDHRLRKAVGLTEVPSLLLVDREGQVRSRYPRWTGAIEPDVSRQLDALVREPRPK